MAFFALSSGVLLTFFFTTSEQRLRQQGIAIVEQSGIALMQTIGNRVRNAERVLDPPAGQSGSILALQLADDSLHPTILALSGSALYVGEADDVRQLSSDDVEIRNLRFRNTSVAENEASILIEFTVERSIPLTTPLTYKRTFQSLAELFPDDESNVTCSCPVPSCSGGAYTWQYCIDNACTDADVDLPCG